jgi:anti-sigma regulatory factor (Ser/Thr protein kinase)
MQDASFEHSFDAAEDAPRRARRWVVEVLQLQGVPAEDVEILVSELVTNSVLHAGLSSGQKITVRAERQQDSVRVEVCDEGGRYDKPSATPGRTEGGRGLHIVESLSEDSGVLHDGVTLVWFTYRVAGVAADPQPVA